MYDNGHYYDCPCDECREPATNPLLRRVLAVIERLENELSRPPEPVSKEYEQALDWLSSVCGGPAAVTALDATPLSGPVPLPDQARVREVTGLLDSVARELFDVEIALAFRRGLLRVWESDPGLVTAPASPAYVAAGVAWAVGEANGVVGAGRAVTSGRLKLFLDLPSSPGVHARPIRTALRGLWPWSAERIWGLTPAVEPLGHLDLLTSRTRAQLIRVRDHALAARAADGAAASPPAGLTLVEVTRS